MIAADTTEPTPSTGRHTVHSAGRNVLLSIAGFAWPVALLAISTPIVLRGLGAAGFGVWALVGNVIGYLGVFNSLQTAGTKYLAEYLASDDRAAIRRLLGTSLLFNVAMGMIGGSAIFAAARPLALQWLAVPRELQAEAVEAFRIAGLGFFVNAVGWWGASILAGAQRYDWLAGIVAVTATLAAGGSILAVELHLGVVGVAWANILSASLAAGGYAWAGRHSLGRVAAAMEFDVAMLRHVLSYGAFSTLQVVFGVVTTQLDRTLLGVWVGVASVTLYSIPLSVASRIHQFAGKALEVVVPLASAGGRDGLPGRTERLFIRAQSVNCLLVLTLSVPLLTLAPEILRVWIGADFSRQAALIFQLLVVAYALLGLSVAAANVVAGLGHPEVNTGFTLVLGAANAAGYVALIPRWGALGAAAASALGSLVAIPLFLWYVRRRFLRIGWEAILRSSVVRPVGAATLAALLTLGLRPFAAGFISVAILAAGSCVVYLALTAWLGVWHPREVPGLRRVWAVLPGA